MGFHDGMCPTSDWMAGSDLFACPVGTNEPDGVTQALRRQNLESGEKMIGRRTNITRRVPLFLQCYRMNIHDIKVQAISTTNSTIFGDFWFSQWLPIYLKY